MTDPLPKTTSAEDPAARRNSTCGSARAESARPETDQAGHDPVQRRTLVVLVAAQILGTISLGVAPTIGILLAEQVTADETWAGLARTSSTFGAALLGLPLGTLAVRYGRRVALTTGWWISAAGAVLLVTAAQHQLVIPLFLGLLMTGAGTAAALQAGGVPVRPVVPKLEEAADNAVHLIASGQVDLVVNSPRGRGSRADGAHIREAATRYRVPLLTTGAAGLAAATGMADWASHRLRVRTLQELHDGRGLEPGGDEQLALPLL